MSFDGTRITPADSNWPPLLRSLKERTINQLWVRGAGINPSAHHLATIGSRSVDQQHLEVVGRFLSQFFRLFAEEYPALSLVLLSGIALGVDGQAHKTALRADVPTTAVLPSRPDRMYPPENLPIAQEILSKTQLGNAILSEYDPAGANGDSYRNPLARNVIVAGMSHAVLAAGIPETRSGTLHTIGIATREKRPVFFLQGTVSESVRQLLIGKFRATEVTEPRQLLDHLGPHLL